MNKQRRQQEEATAEPRLWTHAEAVKAVPYLRSIVGSLREHRLESERARLQVRRIDARRGRPDRHALIRRADAVRDAELAQDWFNEALGELNAIGVYSFDPVKGLALIPFHQGDDLAWFIFDLFAPHGLDGWRLHADSLETRRQLADRQDPGPIDRLFASGPRFWEPRATAHGTKWD